MAFLVQAHLSTNGVRLVIQGSGHDMPIDKPDAVVDAIRKVWRNQGSSSTQAPWGLERHAPRLVPKICSVYGRGNLIFLAVAFIRSIRRSRLLGRNSRLLCEGED